VQGGYKEKKLKLEETSSSLVEAGWNISTVALRVVGGDEKGTQCLGMQLGHPVLGGYKYGDLVLQVGGGTNLKQQNMS
jgi:hypothetical protein